MATENNTPTNESTGSAIPADNGGNVGGALSETDFIRNFKEKLKTEGSTEPKEKHTKEAKAETEAASEEDLDVSDLEDDSSEHEATERDGDSTDTKAKPAEESKDEPEFELQVGGKTVKVKQSELIADAQKGRAAIKQFDEASKMRKEAEEIKTVYTKDRDHLDNLLAQVQNIIATSYSQQEPNWDYLAAHEPAEYIRLQRAYAVKEQQENQAKALREQIQKQREAETTVEAERRIKAQKDRAFKMFPQWKNPEVLERDKSRMVSYLDAEGFTKPEQDGIDDARMLAVIHKAALYDQAIKAKNQKKAKPTTGKTLTSGASQNSDPDFKRRQNQTANAREAKSVQDKFSKTGSQEAFVEMFKNKMRKGR